MTDDGQDGLPAEYRDYIEADRPVRQLLDGTVRRHPDWPSERIVKYVLSKLTASQRRAFLCQSLRVEVSARQRARVRDIEKAAEARARQEQWEAGAEERRRQDGRVAAERAEFYQAHPEHAPRNTRWYKAWARTPSGAAFEAARLEAKREEEARRADIAEIGPHAWFDNNLRRLLADYKETIRLDLTAELLAAEFALGDGRKVTWGAATVADHGQRIDLLMRNAEGNVVTARRHSSAIAMIREAKAATLNEIIAPAASRAS